MLIIACVPIVFTVVESEFRDSWSLLKDYLKEDVKICSPHLWSFIIDKYKGLIKALRQLWDVELEHRHCAEHI